MHPASLLAGELDAALRARAVPGRAAGEKAYLKSDLEHYGASVPAIRAAVRGTLGGRDLGHDDVICSPRSCGPSRCTSAGWPPSRC